MSLPIILRRSFGDKVSMSLPSKCIFLAPTVAVEGNRPISAIMVTDLPEPDSPTTANTSPCLSCKDTSSTARKARAPLPKVTERFSISSSREDSLGCTFKGFISSPALI